MANRYSSIFEYRKENPHIWINNLIISNMSGSTERRSNYIVNMSKTRWSHKCTTLCDINITFELIHFNVVIIKKLEPAVDFTSHVQQK